MEDFGGGEASASGTKGKHDKPKPWDEDPNIDHWKVEKSIKIPTNLVSKPYTPMALTSSLQVPKLTNNNCRMWSIQMEALLCSLDVWDLVETDYTIAETSDGNTIMSQEAWEILKTTYDGAYKVKKIQLQALRVQFEAIQQKASETISDYFSQVISIVYQMRRNSEELKGSKDLEVMDVEKLIRSLQAYEQRILKKSEGRTFEQALQAKHSKEVLNEEGLLHGEEEVIVLQLKLADSKLE
ncbi:hypothetical protein ZIOFF_060808 [Zingiber officinale]|uniref:Uncharacterized protein n=1 Tax=Zingiber officinale TaxID=94328 RepID=A0A8J5FBY9_ZINOF|nr:hypothetical protein ZIOFF_060808 [Zingiber officinale]